MPKVIDHNEIQSGEASGSQPSSAQNKTPIHSRQGIEQHQIDVDLLIQKLLKIPNMDFLDSIFNIEDNSSQIFNIDLEPSNGTIEKKERSTENSVDHMQRI